MSGLSCGLWRVLGIGVPMYASMHDKYPCSGRPTLWPCIVSTALCHLSGVPINALYAGRRIDSDGMASGKRPFACLKIDRRGAFCVCFAVCIRPGSCQLPGIARHPRFHCHRCRVFDAVTVLHGCAIRSFHSIDAAGCASGCAGASGCLT